MIFEKLSRAEDRYREIEQLITLPKIVSDNKEYTKLMKEYKSLTPIIEKYREYKIFIIFNHSISHISICKLLLEGNQK